MKLQVNVSDELVQRIDDCAYAIGMSRSAFCAFLIGQGINSYEQAQTLTSSLVNSKQLVDALVRSSVGRQEGGAGLDPAPSATTKKRGKKTATV